MKEFNDEVLLNVKMTRKNMIKCLKRYRKLDELCLFTNEMRVTSSYSEKIITQNYGLNKLEKVVDKNIKREQLLKERENLKKDISESFNILDEEERFIIENKFLKKYTESDISLYMDLHIGKTKYYDIKNSALMKMAIFLGLEVYESL